MKKKELTPIHKNVPADQPPIVDRQREWLGSTAKSSNVKQIADTVLLAQQAATPGSLRNMHDTGPKEVHAARSEDAHETQLRLTAGMQDGDKLSTSPHGDGAEAPALIQKDESADTKTADLMILSQQAVARGPSEEFGLPGLETGVKASWEEIHVLDGRLEGQDMSLAVRDKAPPIIAPVTTKTEFAITYPESNDDRSATVSKPAISPGSAAKFKRNLRKLFDYSYYATQLTTRLSTTQLLEHFIDEGAAAGLSPHPDYEAQTYLDFNPDIEGNLLGAYLHYALHGRGEKRYASRSRLAQHAAIVQQSGEFDEEYYLTNHNINVGPYGKAIAHYLAIGWRQGYRPNVRFNQTFYLNHYSDSRASLSPPLIHYLEKMASGRRRYGDVSELAGDYDAVAASPMFEKEYYRKRYEKLIPDQRDPIIHFLTEGQDRKLDPSPRMSITYYTRRYADLRNLANPFLHYLFYGVKEQRKVSPSAVFQAIQGNETVDPGKPVVLLVIHEGSRTGAPILGYNLALQLRSKYNIVTWLQKAGMIESSLLKPSTALMKAPADPNDLWDALRDAVNRYSVDLVILNSAACHPLAEIFYQLEVPIVSLVHEFRDYLFPRGTLAKMIMFSAAVVCPAKVVAKSASEECIDFLGWSPNHIHVAHQGRCELPANHAGKDDNGAFLLPPRVQQALANRKLRKVILGAGWVHMRKGVEFFIQAAHLFRTTIDPNVLFVWVGGGYLPGQDNNYSVWLQNEIETSKLEDTVLFIDELPSLKPLYEVADAFFLSSRLDPFPNVAIDAVCNGVPVVAFDQTTGFVEEIDLHPEFGIKVPYLDTPSAVKALDEIIHMYRDDTALRSKTRNTAQAVFQFVQYARTIAGICETAAAMQKTVKRDAKALADSGQFDASFFRSGVVNSYIRQLHEISPEYVYSDLARKGIFPAKPRRGYNEAAQPRPLEASSALLEAIECEGELYSHSVYHFNSLLSTRKEAPTSLKIAAHVHAFETDGLDEILRPLVDSPTQIELVVTTDTDDKLNFIRRLVDEISHVEVQLLKTPNIGRDIGPFLCAEHGLFHNHDIVGHFHVKASSHLDGNLMANWKNFIYRHLLDGRGCLDFIFQLFEEKPRLGLVFPEDPCQIGWTKNAGEARQLAAKLGIVDFLPIQPEFPIGNMFWARSAALKPLWNAGLGWSHFPSEPIKNDGTILHAIERLTPSICRAAGYEWATVSHPNVARA